MRGERIAAPLLALLVVFSGAGGAIAPGASPVGTAEAQLGDGSGGACDSADWFLTFVTGTVLTTDCKTAGDVSEEWNETDAKQTRTQIHSQAGQLEAGNEQFLVAMSNAVKDSNTIAFSKGEAAAVEVLANGGTVSEAQQAANESIADYYTTKQLNLIDRRNVAVETVVTLRQRAVNTTGVNDDFVTLGSGSNFKGEMTGSSNVEYSIDKSTFSGTQTRTIVLSNGTQTTYQTVDYSAEGTGYWPSADATESWQTSGTAGGFDAIRSGEVAAFSNTDADRAHFNAQSIKVRPAPNSTLNSKTALNLTDFQKQLDEIQTSKNQTQTEVAVYINQSLAPAVESGELNATSYVSPATLAQEYAQSYNDSDSYIRATAIAAYSGMDAPNLSETGSMTITHNGTTYEGLLLSQEAPSGGWESGETYDPALLSGLQMFAVAGDNSSIVELDGPFTVESIQGTDGEQIQTATTYNVTYETANSSEDYAELQQQIRSLNEQIEERQAEATAGGSDPQTNTDGILAKIAAALGVGTGVVLLVAAGAVVVIARIYLPDS